uniref:Uncharacterized protein n=1 Tax=Tetraselmis sp. GSL018 TaxID=582737 RepID=A0A061RLA9_9CHLO
MCGSLKTGRRRRIDNPPDCYSVLLARPQALVGTDCSIVDCSIVDCLVSRPGFVGSIKGQRQHTARRDVNSRLCYQPIPKGRQSSRIRHTGSFRAKSKTFFRYTKNKFGCQSFGNVAVRQKNLLTSAVARIEKCRLQRYQTA